MFGMAPSEIITLVLFVAGLVLAVLAILMPWFVYQIAQRSADIEQHARETNLLLRALLNNEGEPAQPEPARSLGRKTPR